MGTKGDQKLPSAEGIGTTMNAGVEIPKLSSAIGKIGGEGNLAALPNDRNDPVWEKVMEQMKLDLFELSALKNHRMALDQEQEPSRLGEVTRKQMDHVVFNWTRTEADPFGLKRKRESGSATGNEEAIAGNSPSKKQRVADGTAIPEVETLYPITDGSWYLGMGGERPLYVRQCVKDLGTNMLKEILNEEKRKIGATCWVISGASGIGKSWSINAFATELLRNGLTVFFHSGSMGRAWLVSKDGIESVDVTEIEMIPDPNVVYVYDSPGSKVQSGPHSQARVRNFIGVSILFSSPKKENYDYAISKTNGLSVVKNLPTWTNLEMRGAMPTEPVEVINRCYSVWGGNMLALDCFVRLTNQEGIEEATKIATMQLDAQIRCIDKKLAEKMSKELEKQQVNEAFGVEDLKNAPGHILTPEPQNEDPNHGRCFQDFVWRFCSPMAEKKFMVHAKTLGKDVVMDLLKSVFEVPSPKRVLFEKGAHFLITNGFGQRFRWCNYNDRNEVDSISFPECKVVNFETDNLKDSIMEALQGLEEGDWGSAVALEPACTSFDAVDMFVLVKEGETGTALDWRLYLLQDTIARKHSLHPLKVLWYCALFLDALKEVLPKVSQTGPVLDCCKYVPVVPHKSKDSFEFEKPESNLKKWEDIDRVAQLINVSWPRGINGNAAKLKNIKAKMKLEIPLTASGGERVLTKTVVGNAILHSHAARKVKEMSRVIFDVLNS